MIKKKMFDFTKGSKKRIWLKRGMLCGIILTMLLPGCSQSASAPYTSGLFISEVVSSNSDSLTDSVYGSPDWIELYNASSNTISLENYTLYESTGNRFTFPTVEIAPQSYLVVFCCLTLETSESVLQDAVDETASAEETASASETATPVPTAAFDAATDQICTGFKLSKDGSDITLAAQSRTLQELTVPALDTDISYGYRDDGTYGYFIQSTPGAANTAPSFASMEELRSGEQVALEISEILPKDVSDTDPYAWVELYNAGASPILLSDYYISENLSNLKKASLPAIELKAGEYAVIRFNDQSSEDTVPFKIGSEETTIAISDHLGVVIDRINWDADILPGISAGQGEDDSAVYYTVPTPGASNSANYLANADISLAEGMDDVYINELLVNNTFSVIDEYGERSPWVELYNASNQPVSLSSYALSDDPESLWKWNLPDITLEANSYLIVYLSGNDQKTEQLHTNFKLGDADKALYLTNLTSQTVQTVALPTESKDNVSCGLSQNAEWMFYPQPTPMAENSTQGFTEISSVGGEFAGVSINEVASVSKSRSGEADWVELYNGSAADIDLSGYFLSDSKNDTTKWPIGNLKIEAGGYEVIGEYEADGSTGELTIALGGETLFLFSPQGLLLDQFETGVLRPGLSRGINTSDAAKSIAFFGDPTPGTQNGSDILSGYCSAPMFSVPGGYQTGSITLEMTTSTEGGVIHYTTDGSTPTEGSAQYTAPLTISDTQTVRAITIADNRITSDETVATYLLDNTHSLPVICLSMTQSDLNYVFGSAERSDTRERAGYVEYYEPDGTLGVSFPAGFRIAGAGTRTAKQKSINLYLRGGYGRSSVTYPFFEGYDITTFKSLSLRNMGAWQDMTRLKDVFVSMAADGMNLDNAQAKFAVVYINGQYWGLYEFKENQNEEYFASRYDIDPDNVVMVRGNKYSVQTGRTDQDIVSLYNLAQRNMNDADTFTEYTSLADSDYFMDYLIAETFFGCYDTYNQKFAHTTDDVMRWRPIYYDFDICLTSKSESYFRTFFCDTYTRQAVDSMGREHVTFMYLYNAFIKNDVWRQKFIERYAEVLNTTLATDNLLAKFDGLVASIEDEIPATSAQWGFPASVSKWERDVESLRDIVEARRGAMIKGLQSYFGLSDDYMKELFPNG